MSKCTCQDLQVLKKKNKKKKIFLKNRFPPSCFLDTILIFSMKVYKLEKK